MPRRRRIVPGGYAYHVLNRAVGRTKIFRKEEDYAAFEQVIAEIHERLPTRLLSYCLMPNHWHMILWPEENGELSEFIRLVTVTHAHRWHAHYHPAGAGRFYQGRFRSFPIQQDEHLIKACRFIERSPLEAKLVKQAEDWPWSSAHKRQETKRPAWMLKDVAWPVRRPRNWLHLLNTPLPVIEQKQIEHSLARCCPLGEAPWVKKTAKRLSLESTLRPQGRQPNVKK